MPAGNTSRPTMNRITERVKGGGRRGERILTERHWGVWVPCHIVCVPIVSQVKLCSMKFWWHKHQEWLDYWTTSAQYTYLKNLARSRGRGCSQKVERPN